MEFGCAFQKPGTVVREETEVTSFVFHQDYILTKYHPCKGSFEGNSGSCGLPTLRLNCLYCGSYKEYMKRG
jgi:hypothetical protein